MYERSSLNNRGIALLALFAAIIMVIVFLGTSPTKYARGFYHVRPLAWWGREDTINIILWNAEQTEVHVKIEGNVSCSATVPPVGFVQATCRVPKARPGEYHVLNICLVSEEFNECGELSLIFD